MVGVGGFKNSFYTDDLVIFKWGSFCYYFYRILAMN